MIEQLDFIYMPTADAARDLGFYRHVLGAEIVFAIEAFGTRVARVELGGGRPALLLAEHLEGKAPVLVFRVADLDAAVAGLDVEERFEIPHGPVAELRTPGGQRLALYELTRPEAEERLAGRYDFEP
jgi:catechol 2,3-dioxygenase-like lactoylglutathione lyase family enzyme